jgi:hypothetical protein
MLNNLHAKEGNGVYHSQVDTILASFRYIECRLPLGV